MGDFLGYAASALADTVPGAPEGEIGHYLRQLGVTGIESMAMHRERLSSSRGNAYLPAVSPSALTAKWKAQPSWDCKPSGGEVEASTWQPTRVACWVASAILDWKGSKRRFPHVEPADYSGPR